MPILLGDCRSILPTLDAGSVRCCVTSPPYWGLRDYGTATWEGGICANRIGENGEQCGAPQGGCNCGGCDHRTAPVPMTPDAPGRRRSPLVGTTETTRAAAEARTFRDVCGKCGARRIDSQIGLEKTPDEYVAEMVGVFRHVWRVLADDGTLWLNLGDSYGAQQGKGFNTHACTGGPNRVQAMQAASDDIRLSTGLKPKDLVGVPWRVAFALQADGWYLRSDIIWHKPNPMPESVTDRPTKAHEYVFLLSKSARYFYDAGAIQEPMAEASAARYAYAFGGAKTEALIEANKTGIGQRTRVAGMRDAADGRNARSVWTIPTQPTPDAHFATFPEALAERCILAGSAEGDTVLDPFFGSGTVGKVAERLGRNWIGIELNPSYVGIAEEKTSQMGLFL